MLTQVSAQNIAINSTGASGNASAILDISSSDKGFLMPRVVLNTTTDPISGTKPSGLLVYNNGGSFGQNGFYYWSGSTWTPLSLPSGTSGQTMRHNGTNWVANSALYNDGTNIGISTTNPRAVLNVYDPDESTTQTNFTQSLSNAGVVITTDYTNTAYTPGVFWSTTNDNPSMPKAGIYLYETDAGSKMLFGTSTLYSSGITNTALAIDDNGNIGIGSTSPTAQLHTTGNVTFATFAGGGDQLLKVNNSGQVSTAAMGSSSDMLLGDGTYSPITDEVILNQSASNQTADFRISGNGIFNGGNVGVGTTSPAYRLQVAGTAGFDEYIYHNGDADTYIQYSSDQIAFNAGGVDFMRMIESSNDVLVINEDGVNLDLRVEGDSDANLLYVDASTDRVGISTSAPSVKLHVDGDMYAEDLFTVGGSSSIPPGDFRMMVRNAINYDGLVIRSGDNLGDISFRIENDAGTLNILDVETDLGFMVFGKTYAQTVSDNGIVYGMDNQHSSGNVADFNTQNGVYRMAGEEITPYNIGGGISSNLQSATSGTSTSSSSYSAINSMSSTPAAGTYIVSLSASGKGNSNDQEMQVCLYVDGLAVSHTERDYGYEADSNNNERRFSIHTQAIVTVDGTEDIEARYRTNTGTFTVYERTMTLLKVAD